MTSNPSSRVELEELASKLTEALRQCTDNEWNYSRIYLVVSSLTEIVGPYCLACELVNPNDKDGRQSLRLIEDEIKWGGRHGEELGILEIISLRLNKALLGNCDLKSWNGQQPVIRIVKKEAIQEQGITAAFWYAVEEVSGEEFENR